MRSPDFEPSTLATGSTIESPTAIYRRRIAEVIDNAMQKTVTEIGQSVEVDPNGLIVDTKRNKRLMRSVAERFDTVMRDGGYQAISDAYKNFFQLEMPPFGTLIEQVAGEVGHQLTRVDKEVHAKKLHSFTPTELQTLVHIHAEVQGIGDAVLRESLFNSGIMTHADLCKLLMERFRLSFADAETIAVTSQTVHYRTLADIQSQYIEADLPQMKIRYEYGGPNDILTRPFCAALLAAGKSYSREQINEMHNGQLPNVFLTGGGIGCRHIWLLSV